MILRPYKEIKRLNKVIETLEEDVRYFKQLAENKEGDVKNKHKCGIWCNGCENLIQEPSWNAIQGIYNLKFCKLDSDCKDRKEKDDN